MKKKALKAAKVSVPKSLYSREGLGIAAHVFAGRAEVYLEETKKDWKLELRPRSPRAAENLAGEFVNELLNQEYRFLVSGFNAKVSSLIVAQTLLSARGGENPSGPRPEEETPEFKAETERLLAAARDEIARTMPKRIAPQGNPLPPDESA